MEIFDLIPTSKTQWIHSLIFLRIPKTASTSITKVLGERNLLNKHKKTFIDKFQNSPLYRGVFDVEHCLPEEIFNIFGRQVFNFFSFAVIREPVERIISSYFFGKGNDLSKVYGLNDKLSLDEYIDWLYENRGRKDILILLPQSTWTHSEIFRPKVILRFEFLQDDWKKMLKTFDIKGFPDILPFHNKSKKTDFSISPESIKKIQEIYQKDYDLFGF